ncbi:MAG: LamG domain-containing protein [Alphaproteobacteria bacterium]|nr:LamG domain-containing protein [Alphaproteobacteria bacterium]
MDNDCDGYDDTLGFWSFEAGTGSTAFDASAWGHDGIITGASWTTSGYQGGALDFDGSNDDVELPYSTLEPTTGFTISAWVSPDSLRASSWDSIVSRGSTGTTAELGCCADPYYVGYYRTDMSFYTDSTSSLGGIVDGGGYSGHVGGWHHVLVTADYSSGARVIYVDGAQTATDGNAPSTPIFDGAPTRFGADTNSGSAVLPFDGRIDEIKIFDCPVDAGQAAADYSSGWPF